MFYLPLHPMRHSDEDEDIYENTSTAILRGNASLNGNRAYWEILCGKNFISIGIGTSNVPFYYRRRHLYDNDTLGSDKHGWC